MLLAKGADVNHVGKDKVTALMVAASDGNVLLCEMLIEKKANVNAKNVEGDSALIVAVMHGRAEAGQYPLCPV